MAKRKASRAKPAVSKIPAEQLELPVTFDAAGKPVTLREAIAPGYGSVLAFASLSPEKRAELTIKRIEAQPTFEMAMIDGGIVDKSKAIQEVSSQTDIGKTLVEIEQRVINNLLEVAASK